MSSFRTQVVYQAPIATVYDMALRATMQSGLSVKVQMPPWNIKAKSGITLMSYPVTVQVTISGTDGQAVVQAEASNFGFGPIQTKACRDKVELLLNLVGAQLASAAATPPMPAAQ